MRSSRSKRYSQEACETHVICFCFVKKVVALWAGVRGIPSLNFNQAWRGSSRLIRFMPMLFLIRPSSSMRRLSVFGFRHFDFVFYGITFVPLWGPCLRCILIQTAAFVVVIVCIFILVFDSFSVYHQSVRPDSCDLCILRLDYARRLPFLGNLCDCGFYVDCVIRPFVWNMCLCVWDVIHTLEDL